MIRLLLFFLVFANGLLSEQPAYQFAGKHFIASYLSCKQEAISNVEELLKAMNRAVEASGATVLKATAHVFPPNGLTAVCLLSESHASIHTYPEYGACFVDLFTCGDHCSSAKFHEILQSYLEPEEMEIKTFSRHKSLEEI